MAGTGRGLLGTRCSGGGGGVLGRNRGQNCWFRCYQTFWTPLAHHQPAHLPIHLHHYTHMMLTCFFVSSASRRGWSPGEGGAGRAVDGAPLLCTSNPAVIFHFLHQPVFVPCISIMVRTADLRWRLGSGHQMCVVGGSWDTNGQAG